MAYQVSDLEILVRFLTDELYRALKAAPMLYLQPELSYDHRSLFAEG